MANFAKLAATAKRLIEKNGRSLEVQIRPAAPANAAKPWRGPGAALPAAVAEVVGVILDFQLTAETSDFVRRGWKRALVAATSTEVDLKPATQLLDGTELWEIHSVRTLVPGPVTIIYEFHLKK